MGNKVIAATEQEAESASMWICHQREEPGMARQKAVE